jgi:hypothetical protein
MDAGKYSHGFHIFRDGNAWCAVGPHFIDLMKSNAGFGDTPQDAVNELCKKFEGQSWWRNKALPTLDEFKIDFDNERRQRECNRYEDCETGVGICHCLSP